MITNPNLDLFNAAVSSGKPVVVDFNATWCGPCKMIAPIFEELAEQYADRAEFFSVDVDECEDLAINFKVRNIPPLLFIKNGEVVSKQVGAAAKPVLVEKIEGIL